MKRIISLLLLFILVFSTGAQALAAPKTNASTWAVPAMEKAFLEGYIPQAYMEKAKSNITRLEFCKIVVLFYEKNTGEKLLPKSESPFEDTKDPAVIAAFEAKIVSGITKTKFDPAGNITREQAAIMLVRVLRACGVSLESVEKESPFGDIQHLYPFSIEAINQVYGAGILSGDKNGNFAPERQLTIQEAAATFMKAVAYYDKAEKQNLPKEDGVEGNTATTPSLEKPEQVVEPIVMGVYGEEHTITIGEKTVSLGQSPQEVIGVWGNPDRKDETVYGLERYVYIGAYQTYFFVTFKDGAVAEIFVPGSQFDYMGTKGVGTVVDIKKLTRMSAAEHSGIILSEEAQARVPLDFEGNISGILLQTNEFASAVQLKSGIHRSLYDSIQAELFDFIQVKRVEAGLSLLTFDEKLSDVAEEHSKDMAEHEYVAYNGLNGSTPFSRILSKGITYQTASEVIAKKRGDTVNIYQEWVRTTATIGGILNTAMDTCGIGVAQKNMDLYVTVDFCGNAKK